MLDQALEQKGPDCLRMLIFKMQWTSPMPTARSVLGSLQHGFLIASVTKSKPMSPISMMKMASFYL